MFPEDEEDILANADSLVAELEGTDDEDEFEPRQGSFAMIMEKPDVDQLEVSDLLGVGGKDYAQEGMDPMSLAELAPTIPTRGMPRDSLPDMKDEGVKTEMRDLLSLKAQERAARSAEFQERAYNMNKGL